jgi:hypothetical protein
LRIKVICFIKVFVDYAGDVVFNSQYR